MRIYFTTEDGGDGSASVMFTTDSTLIERLEEASPEYFGMGEGGSWFDLPDGTDISGLSLSTAEDYDYILNEEN